METSVQLGDCYLVNGLTVSQVKKLVSESTEKTLFKNEIIFKEGEMGQSIFVLLEGKVCLERRLKKQRPDCKAKPGVWRDGFCGKPAQVGNGTGKKQCDIAGNNPGSAFGNDKRGFRFRSENNDKPGAYSQ